MSRRTPLGMDEDTAWQIIDSQRSDLARFLDDLSPQEWSHPSLCRGWRVRDVVAHLALAQMGVRQAAVEALRARGSFNRMVHDTALRHAATPPARLVEEIRAMVGSRRKPPGVSYMEPLLDVLVHGQDIAVPLGRPRTMPTDAAVAVADRVWSLRGPMSLVFQAQTRLRGLRLQASDADWSAGEGALVEGPIPALLLLLTGRTSACLEQLSGPGLTKVRLAAAESSR